MHTQPLLLTWLGQTAGSAAGPQGCRRPGRPACRRRHRQQSRRPGPGRVRSGHRCSGCRQGQAVQVLDARHPPAAQHQLPAHPVPNFSSQPTTCRAPAASPAPAKSQLPAHLRQAGVRLLARGIKLVSRLASLVVESAPGVLWGSDEARQVGRDRSTVSMMPDAGVGSPRGCM